MTIGTCGHIITLDYASYKPVASIAVATVSIMATMMMAVQVVHAGDSEHSTHTHTHTLVYIQIKLDPFQDRNRLHNVHTTHSHGDTRSWTNWANMAAAKGTNSQCDKLKHDANEMCNWGFHHTMPLYRVINTVNILDIQYRIKQLWNLETNGKQNDYLNCCYRLVVLAILTMVLCGSFWPIV